MGSGSRRAGECLGFAGRSSLQSALSWVVEKKRNLSNSNGALVVRMGFGVYYAISIIRNPRNPSLIIKAPTLRLRS